MKCPTCGQEAEVKVTDVKQEKDVMLYVAGSKHSFRCVCGANVFRKHSETISGVCYYECNGCEALYEGEK